VSVFVGEIWDCKIVSFCSGSGMLRGVGYGSVSRTRSSISSDDISFPFLRRTPRTSSDERQSMMPAAGCLLLSAAVAAGILIVSDLLGRVCNRVNINPRAAGRRGLEGTNN